MKKSFTTLFILVALYSATRAQVAISTTGQLPQASTMLEVSSTKNQYNSNTH